MTSTVGHGFRIQYRRRLLRSVIDLVAEERASESGTRSSSVPFVENVVIHRNPRLADYADVKP